MKIKYQRSFGTGTVPAANTAVVIFAVLFFMLVNPLQGFDIGVFGGAGNIVFDAENKTSLSDGEKAFEPNLFPIIRTMFSGENGIIFYRGGFDRTPVLRNRLYANAGVDLSFFSMEVGPFIGLFNTQEEIFNPGLCVALGVQIPGVFFINIETSTSLGASLETVGSYTQKTGIISAGFWVPHVICSLNINSRTFAQKTEINLLAEDSLDRYFFRADFFTKNVPFTMKVDLGYAMLKRSYSTQDVEAVFTPPDVIDAQIVTSKKSDEFNFIYIGLEMVYSVNSMFKLYLSGEMPVYSWSTPKMKNPAKSTFLFEATGGIILTL